MLGTYRAQRDAAGLCDNGSMSSARSTRAVRGLVAAVFATFVALFSHIIGGGATPGTLGIAVPLVFSAFVCVLLAGRRLSLFRLTLSVAVSQFLFHTLFMLGTVQGVASSPAMGGHAMHGAPIVLDAAVMPMSHGTNTGSGMWVTHGIAALVTVAVIHWAEKLLAAVAAVKEFVLAQLVPGGQVALADVAAPVNPARLPVQGRVPLLRPLGMYPATLALRGPPALSCL